MQFSSLPWLATMLLLLAGVQPLAAETPDVDLQLEWQFAVGFGATETGQAYQGDLIYLSVRLTDREGRPLENERLQASSASGNMIIEHEPITGADGATEVMVIAEKLGDDVVAVSGAGVTRSVSFRVEEPPVDDFAAYAAAMAVPELEGVVSWQDLTSVEVEYRDYALTARFPEKVRALDGQRIRLAGFMTPLDNSENQRHFVISSQPPHCFFHFLAGPASVAEIMAPEGVRFSYDPIILSGTLEIFESSELGILYRLTDARLEGTL
jgi:hypothetical protein